MSGFIKIKQSDYYAAYSAFSKTLNSLSEQGCYQLNLFQSIGDGFQGMTAEATQNKIQGIYATGIGASSIETVTYTVDFFKVFLPQLEKWWSFSNDMYKTLENDNYYISSTDMYDISMIEMNNHILLCKFDLTNSIVRDCNLADQAVAQIRDTLLSAMSVAGISINEVNVPAAYEKVHRVQALKFAVELYHNSLQKLEEDIKINLAAIRNGNYALLPSNEGRFEYSLLDKSQFEGMYTNEITLEVVDILEEYLRYENLYLTETDQLRKAHYKEILDGLQKRMDELILAQLSKANHSEVFLNVFEYIAPFNYSYEDKVKIFCYWESVDKYDSLLGIEMPDWWCKKYLTMPKGLTVNEKNFDEFYIPGSEQKTNLICFYLSGYCIIDLISGQFYANEKGFQNPQDLYDYLCMLRNYDVEIIGYYSQYDRYEPFAVWYDYMYGAINDYAKGEMNPRVIKYILGEFLGFEDAISDQGMYHVYTNDKNPFYELLISAYLSKYNHSEEYYDQLDKILNNEKKLLELLKKDIKNPIELSPKEQALLHEMKINGYDSNEHLYNYVEVNYLARLLDTHMYGVGTREIVIEGDKIHITFSGNYDGTKMISGSEFTIDLSGAYKGFGTYYYSREEFERIILEISEQQVRENLISEAELTEFNQVIGKLIQEFYTEEELNGMSDDRYQKLLNSARVAYLEGDLLYDCFSESRGRLMEEVEQAKDEMINSLQKAAFLA